MDLISVLAGIAIEIAKKSISLVPDLKNEVGVMGPRIHESPTANGICTEICIFAPHLSLMEDMTQGQQRSKKRRAQSFRKLI